MLDLNKISSHYPYIFPVFSNENMFASGEPTEGQGGVSTTVGAALAGDALRGSGGQTLAAQHILGTPSYTYTLIYILYIQSFFCVCNNFVEI